MGLLYPQSVKASHVNMIRANPPEYKKNPLLAAQHALAPYSEREKKGMERSAWFNKEGSGYNLEQRTKPQTIGYALADSPVALLAWVYEVRTGYEVANDLILNIDVLHAETPRLDGRLSLVSDQERYR
jgi:hypothetical protein